MRLSRIWTGSLIVFAAAGSIATLARAQTISNETFDAPGTPWTANGVETLVDDGRGMSGQFLTLPFSDYFGVHLRNEDPRSGALGDLTRYPRGLRISFDMRTFQFLDFDGNPIPASSRPLIFQLTDRGDPNDFSDDVSVWFEGPAIPAFEDGWRHFEFTLPDPTSAALPPGWGGTGDEDPVTFEPRLPPSRTYASVLQSVDEVVFTTFKPGYFYGSSFWEVGFDNVQVADPCPCDVNADGHATVQDIFDYLTAYFSNNAAIADFNRDRAVTVQDIFDFLTCYFASC